MIYKIKVSNATLLELIRQVAQNRFVQPDESNTKV